VKPGKELGVKSWEKIEPVVGGAVESGKAVGQKIVTDGKSFVEGVREKGLREKTAEKLPVINLRDLPGLGRFALEENAKQAQEEVVAQQPRSSIAQMFRISTPVDGSQVGGSQSSRSLESSSWVKVEDEAGWLAWAWQPSSRHPSKQ
jgi:hypothetical protein